MDTFSSSPDIDAWALKELSHLTGCGKRLRRRLGCLLTDCSRKPGASLPRASGSRSRTKGACRCLSNPKVQTSDLLASHSLATWQRMQAHEVVLAVADTTSLNHTTHPRTQGLGALHQAASSARGLFLHSVMTFSEEGEALGLLHAFIWARSQVRGRAGRRDINRRSLQSKESHRWLAGYEAVAAQSRQQRAALPDTRHPEVIMVADREADIYELFLSAQAGGQHCGLLVRALHPRRLEEEQGTSVWQHLRELPPAGTMSLEVPAQGTRRARTATLSLRSAAVTLSAPQDKKKHFKAHQPLHLWALEAVETHAPAGVEPLHWKLLSTRPAASVEEVRRQLGWYARRWGIEVFHKTLKSGCQAEERQLGTREKLERMLMVDAIVAWRVMAVTHAARSRPGAPASEWLSEAECQALSTWATKKTPPPQAPSVAQAVAWLAQLGGFLGRKSDGQPGVQSVWLGLRSLQPMVELWKALPVVGNG